MNEIKVNENSFRYITNRGLRLIIPLLIYNVIYGIINYIGCKNVIEVLKNFIMLTTAAHLYYIVALFQLVILTPIIIKLMKNKKSKTILYSITPIYLIIVLIYEVI